MDVKANCPTEIELLEHVAGNLPDERRRAVADHLRDCATCVRTHDQFAATWTDLGRWAVELPNADLTDRVLVSVGPGGSRTPSPTVRPLFAVMRAAAAILVAAGLGSTFGYLVTPEPGSEAANTPAISREDITTMLGIEHLGAPSASGLSEPVVLPAPLESESP